MVVQLSAVHSNTGTLLYSMVVQRSAVQCTSEQFSLLQRNALQYQGHDYSMVVQRSALQYSTV